jgi:hypothetical protein
MARSSHISQSASKGLKPTRTNRAKVIDLVCSGFSQEDIAVYMDLKVDTLINIYGEELKKSKMLRTSKLGRNLYLDALAGCKQSREFWLKTQGRWSFAKEQETVDKTDKMIELLVQLNQNTLKK